MRCWQTSWVIKMKRTLLLMWLLWTCGLLLFLSRCDTADLALTTGEISGIVSDSVSGEPIRSAMVSIEELTSITTDFQGDFRFPPLEVNLYTLRTARPGYDTLWKAVQIYSGKHDTILIRLNPIILPAPILSFPPNGDGEVMTSPTRLSWNPVEGATSYDIEISEVPTFTPLVSERRDHMATLFDACCLARGQGYVWRVRGRDKQGVTSAWSQVWSFVTESDASVPSPILGAPSAGATEIPLNPTRLEWSAVGGADAYDIEISLNPTFTLLVAEARNHNATQFEASDLSQSQIYYWRVRAISAGIYSPWSEIRNFSTEGLEEAGPRAYYPFSGNTNEESGNGYHGSACFSPRDPLLTEDRFGNANNAYLFDGDDCINVGNREIISTPFSISVWVRRTEAISDWEAIINKLSFFAGWYLGMHPAYGIRITIASSITNFAWAQGGEITINTWTHIVATYDGSVLQLFQDKIKVAEGRTTLSIATTPDVDLLIGLESAPLSSGFKGVIDDIRLYDRVLRSEDIEALYSEGNWTGN